ncbi:MAG TPA: ABC transporter permease [Candidatus Methanoperedens sp.]|nr:ABC transporter permease [Candidatus Methanoperedens sp.]
MNLRRVAHLVRKELLQLRRDPQMLRIVFISPLFQLFIFGYAVSTDVRHVATALLDQDRSVQSRELAERFARSGYFDLERRPDDPREVDALLDAGSVQAALVIPRGFAADLAADRTARVQLLIDGSDSMTAAMVAGYAAGIAGAYSARVASERLERLRARVQRVPAVEERTRVWYNPELRSVRYMVPGVFSLILFLVTMLLTSMAIVKEREIGTLEQLVVTPIAPAELIVGKTLPYIGIGFVDMLLVLALATFWFDVPVAGSVTLLFALSLVFIFTSLGLGLFISTVSLTQQQAMMTSFFIMLPSILLSGFIFPIANMPVVIQWLTHVIPLRYFLVIVRGIFLKGNGFAVLWPQVAVLLVFGAAILGLAALRFKKRLG